MSLLLRNVRVRHCHLTDLRASRDFPEAKPAVDITVLMAKDDPQVQALINSCYETVSSQYGDTKDAMWQKLQAQMPWKDGDQPVGVKNPKIDDYSKGHWRLSFRNQSLVPIVDGMMVPMQPTMIYPGCVVNVFIHSFVNRQFNTFSCWFDGVQFVDNGERFPGGAPGVEEMFSKIEGAPQSNAYPQAVPDQTPPMPTMHPAPDAPQQTIPAPQPQVAQPQMIPAPQPQVAQPQMVPDPQNTGAPSVVPSPGNVPPGAVPAPTNR